MIPVIRLPDGTFACGPEEDREPEVGELHVVGMLVFVDRDDTAFPGKRLTSWMVGEYEMAFDGVPLGGVIHLTADGKLAFKAWEAKRKAVDATVDNFRKWALPIAGLAPYPWNLVPSNLLSESVKRHNRLMDLVARKKINPDYFGRVNLDDLDDDPGYSETFTDLDKEKIETVRDEVMRAARDVLEATGSDKVLVRFTWPNIALDMVPEYGVMVTPEDGVPRQRLRFKLWTAGPKGAAIMKELRTLEGEHRLLIPPRREKELDVEFRDASFVGPDAGGEPIQFEGHCPKCGRKLVERELLTSTYMGCPECDK